ncbi:hypothetical protein DN069_08160 [Streptacidiphilus pinicola]|uniref:IrrE N-terminal-like domain-containing protein n=1 Tax=Streptacidiphilus pinicola TaxID=2219663 RepID=A0A2X0IM24_9ACTN|nr:hypothetical protein [Streptacidiphilus pinicola]RAG86164.1 hypothetical protein DN069_08160 [Streptacidiphilus pinicola]
MDDRQLRRECADLVRSLDVPSPFNIPALADTIAAQRGRTIELVPMPMAPRPNSPCGLWVATDGIDYVMYSEQTTRRQQQHIQLHELAHILLGHESTETDEDEMARLLMPNLDPALVRLVLGRTVYDSTEERRAETVASLIPLHVGRQAGAPHPTTAVSTGAATLAHHLGAALERSAPRKQD